MPLCKDFCKKCYESFDWNWTGMHDFSWDIWHELFCYARSVSSGSFLDCRGRPPHECPYLFEQIVAEAMTNADV